MDNNRLIYRNLLQKEKYLLRKIIQGIGKHVLILRIEI